MTDRELAIRLQKQRELLAEDERLDPVAAEAAGVDLAEHLADRREVVAATERALELRREYEGKP